MDFEDCPVVDITASEDFYDNLLVIDGDFLAFMCAASLEDKTVNVYDSLDNLIGNYKNKTAFKNSSDYREDIYYRIEDHQVLPDDWKDQIPLYLRVTVNNWLKLTSCDKVLIALGGKTNYREEVPTPTKYKSSRKDSVRPLALTYTKELLEKMYKSERPLNGEADDIVTSYQWYSYQNPEKHIVVATVDKDNRMTPCSCLFNPQTKDSISIDSGLGTLVLKEKPYKLKATGRLMLYVQLMLGDVTDSYSPCDVYKQINNISKVSPVLTDYKVYNLLKDCQTDRECWEVILNQYKEWYGTEEVQWTSWDGSTQKGTYIDILQMTFTQAFMKRWEEDYPKVRSILDKLGIEYT